MHTTVDLLSSIGLCVTAAAVLALIGSRLRQPLILAYLLAGVIIGPEVGLGLISDHQSIHNLAEIGLILLLFLIGMELDPRTLVEAGKPVVMTGLLQFPLCVGLAMGLFKLFGPDVHGAKLGLLYLSICLGMSSTMIAVKLLYEKMELDTLPGRITLGVLVFQDIWAIVVLAVQPNLMNPQFGPLLSSVAKSAVLVGFTIAVSRWVLPPIFRSAAKQPELILLASLAWCFAVCGASSYCGLSREMGALMAGVSLSAFPYNLDVMAKVISIRDFFVTLFFVALGMQIPAPTLEVLVWAFVISAFLVVSRLVSVFPILQYFRLGHRASLLPAVNLAQMSEFSLVIASLGVTYGHIPNQLVTLLIFVFALTAIGSSYLIGRNEAIARRLSALLKMAGVNDLAPHTGTEGTRTGKGKDILVLGFYHQASALLHEWERPRRPGEGPSPLNRVLVIDFNPQVHAELKRRGVACIYGDLAHMETLHHAHIDEAQLILLTIPDSILRGTSNRRLLQQTRRLQPYAKVVATADRVGQALALYEAGADYVFIPHLESAHQRAEIVEAGLRSGFEDLRAKQIAELRARDEVLA